ncbi:iron complex transport system ATP-binding protein [Agrobacterium vitis]|nr:iron complex transport system ATP-binding protein [Agrobacterium vitis]MBE1436327.1 iron complex transport system ATP-binding protein [Agrobacterium vitis]
MTLIKLNGATALRKGPWLKREYGEDYPKGTESVAAPATVSDEWVCNMPLAKSREGAGQQRPASQETCHSDVQPQRTGCSDGQTRIPTTPEGVDKTTFDTTAVSQGRLSRCISAGQGVLMSCNMRGAALKVENLRYSLPDREPLISKISFSIEPGDRLAIIGPNGSGKTTLLRCLYRAVKPCEGRVLLDGQDFNTLAPRDIAQRIAVVVQEAPAAFPFTVEDIVMMGRIPWRKGLITNHSKERAKALHAMEHLNLGGMEKRSFATLSGGEKQRVLVARALAQEPQLLILDEPSNHLDIRNQLEILDLLADLGITIITTLHDINLAAGFATKAAILHRGHMIACGTPDDVLTPQHISNAFDVRTHAHTIQGGSSHHFSFALNV